MSAVATDGLGVAVLVTGRDDVFDKVEIYHGDPILGLLGAYRADPRVEKINLGIGIYQDERGRVPVFEAVARAQGVLRGAEAPAPGYLPMEGDARFRALHRTLVLGSDVASFCADRSAIVQTPGGSGALQVGADLLRRCLPESRVWLSTPTWSNHEAIFAGVGFEVGYYPYYDVKTGGVDVDALHDFLTRLPPRDIVVLHPCCHNPTGAGLTPEDWAALATLFRERDLLAFFDMAYQGFGVDVAQDNFAIRLFCDAGLSLFVGSSASKNFSLYEERVGSLTLVAQTRDQAHRLFGQAQASIRRSYSSPPAYGARVVAQVMQSVELTQLWQAELAEIRARLTGLRQSLTRRLSAVLPDRDWSAIARQDGMFTTLDITPDAVEALRAEHGIYMTGQGRICLSGLTESTTNRFAQALAAVCRNGAVCERA